MIINNGIINQGNGNINIANTNFNYQKIIEELQILNQYIEEDLHEAIDAAKKENTSKLIATLKKMKNSTYELMKKLGLTALEKFIEKMIF